MKRKMIYFGLFVFIIFVMPVICTRSSRKVEAINKDENQVEENGAEGNGTEDNGGEENGVEGNADKETAGTSENKQDMKIKLYHKDSGNIEEISMNEYLYGTVSAEMPASYEMEALKAQAVVSRTYTIYQMKKSKKHEGADICDDSTCCQAWISKENRFAKWKEEDRENNWNKIVEAVNSTTGKVITYDGKVIDAFFHSNSGGKTETVANVWGGTNMPYLQSVETSGETEYSQYNSEVKLTKDELNNKMRAEFQDFAIDWQNDAIKILEYTESGRVKTLKIGNKEIAGTKARSLLGLKSTNFKVEIEGNNIKFLVIGNGHGVGMSQTGADSMAKAGSSYEEIVKHFYTGVEVVDYN